MTRVFTVKFFTNNLRKYQRNTKKSITDIIDFGNLDVNVLIDLIRLGNPPVQGGLMPEDDAADKLDKYLEADENNTIISAYFTLLKEFDADMKLIKATGKSIDNIESELRAKMNNNTAKALGEETVQEKVVD